MNARACLAKRMVACVHHPFVCLQIRLESVRAAWCVGNLRNQGRHLGNSPAGEGGRFAVRSALIFRTLFGRLFALMFDISMLFVKLAYPGTLHSEIWTVLFLLVLADRNDPSRGFYGLFRRCRLLKTTKPNGVYGGKCVSGS